MEASTDFFETARPSRRNWARTRGEPYVPPEASKASATAASRRPRRRCVADGGRLRRS